MLASCDLQNLPSISVVLEYLNAAELGRLGLLTLRACDFEVGVAALGIKWPHCIIVPSENIALACDVMKQAERKKARCEAVQDSPPLSPRSRRRELVGMLRAKRTAERAARPWPPAAAPADQAAVFGPGKLGIKLALDDADRILFDGATTGDSPGAALSLGAILVRVNGLDVALLRRRRFTFDAIIRFVSAQPRPLTLEFKRERARHSGEMRRLGEMPREIDIILAAQAASGREERASRRRSAAAAAHSTGESVPRRLSAP